MSRVEVRPSPIEGLGVFATRSFHAWERIRRVNVVREITADAPLREDAGERPDHLDYPDDRAVLFGLPDRHINHSCDPNAYLLHDRGDVFVVARRDIAAGEEITCDYSINITGGSSWPCRCGSPRCRGIVIGDFFRLPEERQREYQPLLAEWFVRKNRERLAAAGLLRQGGHSGSAA